MLLFYNLHTLSKFIHFWLTGNTVDKTMQWKHLNKHINIYLHRECCKASFICCFIVTAKTSI